MLGDIERILLDEGAILPRLEAMAAEISALYEGEELTVLCILNGSIIFAADLLRRLNLPLQLQCLHLSSYHGGTQSSGTVTFGALDLAALRGRHVLVLDDILDSGLTLQSIAQRLQQEAAPKSVRAAVLLQKRRKRAHAAAADFVGFEIEDEFVVGYGLDYQGRYRNLPFIGVLKRELYA